MRVICLLLFYFFSISKSEKTINDLMDPLLIWPRPKTYTVGETGENQTIKYIDPC